MFPPPFLFWLPTPNFRRTALVAIVTFPIYFMFQEGKLRIIAGIPPVPLGETNCLTQALLRKKPDLIKDNPIRIALEYKELLNRGLLVSEIAGNYGISRVRVYQYLKLLTLDQRVINYFLNLKDAKVLPYWTERRLRGLLAIENNKHWEYFNAIRHY